MISLVDVCMILIVGGFVLFGVFFGFVHSVCSLLGTIISVVIASRGVDAIIAKFGFMFGSGATGRVLAFIAIFFIVSRVIGLVFWFARKLFGFFSIIPFATVVDRILGACFGFAEGVIFIGVAVAFALRNLPTDVVTLTLKSSVIGDLLIALASGLQVLVR